MKIAVKNRCPDLPLPSRGSPHAAGFDLHAAVVEPIDLPPGERATIPTGITMAIPSGYEGQVRARSGLASRHGIGLLNAPGTVDADYRGEIKVILVNLGQQPFTIRRGDRIAQLVIAPVVRCELEQVAELEETIRGARGFGSTGT
jgi:dUTP pyrophosphatase